MDNNWKVMLDVMIDKSSLTKAEKKLAKERLKISADIDISNFPQTKRNITRQINQLSKEIQSILGNCISNKDAGKWAAEFYKQFTAGTRDASSQVSQLADDLQNNLTQNINLAAAAMDSIELPQNTISAFELLSDRIKQAENVMNSFHQAAQAAWNTLEAYNQSKLEISAKAGTAPEAKGEAGTAASFLSGAAQKGASHVIENFA